MQNYLSGVWNIFWSFFGQQKHHFFSFFFFFYFFCLFKKQRRSCFSPVFIPLLLEEQTSLRQQLRPMYNCVVSGGSNSSF